MGQRRARAVTPSPCFRQKFSGSHPGGPGEGSHDRVSEETTTWRRRLSLDAPAEWEIPQAGAAVYATERRCDRHPLRGELDDRRGGPSAAAEQGGSVRRTNEQRVYTDFLNGQVAAARLRVRVVPDVEGFPIIPGRYGQVEYYGPEAGTGAQRQRVFTATPKMIKRLLAIPGVRPQQMGDHEARLWFPAGDPDCLRAVCRVIRARIRRLPTTARALHSPRPASLPA